MPRTSKRTKKQRVLDAVKEHGWNLIGREEWAELRAALPDFPEDDLRHALREVSSSVEVLQPWRGVEQHTFEELERSLRALSGVYLADVTLHHECRHVVIEAKDHARLASKNPHLDGAKRAEKEEMVDWMLIWLADPAVFPTWAALRMNRKHAAP